MTEIFTFFESVLIINTVKNNLMIELEALNIYILLCLLILTVSNIMSVITDKTY